MLQLVEAHGRKVSADLRDGIVAAYLDTLPADEAWAIASQRVEDGQLAPDSDIAASALESALAEVSGAQAWDIARRAVELKVTDRDSELAQAAFSAYLATLPPEEAWNAVYTARRDGTQSISDEAFMAVYTAYADTVPVDRLWSDFIGYVRDGKLELFHADAPRQALSAYLRLLSDELAAGSDRDMAAWAEEQAEALNAVAADPDAALTFVYALKDAGRDPAALFPSGLLVDIPMADRVCNLVNRLTNSLSPGRTPNVSTVLPVSIVQKSNTLSSISTASTTATATAITPGISMPTLF